MKSFPCLVSLPALRFALEALARTVPLGPPCPVHMFQPGFQLHRIVHQGVWSPLPFPHLLSKCKWPHPYHSSFFQRGEVSCSLFVVLGLSFLLSPDLFFNWFSSNRLASGVLKLLGIVLHRQPSNRWAGLVPMESVGVFLCARTARYRSPPVALAFRLFNSCFSFAVYLLVPQTPRSVLETPLLVKIAEFLASKLWTIVTYHNV